MIKAVKETAINLNMVDCTYLKANILCGGGIIRDISTKVETRHRIPLSPLLLNSVLEMLASAGELKGIRMSIEEIKLPLFIDGIIVSLKNPRESMIN